MAVGLWGLVLGFRLGFFSWLFLMISPPLAMLERDPTADALATLIAFAALYLIFKKEAIGYRSAGINFSGVP
jgi:hypothetical protein